MTRLREPDLVHREPPVAVVDQLDVRAVPRVHRGALPVPLQFAAGVNGEGDSFEEDAVVGVHDVAIDYEADLVALPLAREAVVDRAVGNGEGPGAQHAAQARRQHPAMGDARSRNARAAGAGVPLTHACRPVAERPAGAEPVAVIRTVESLK